MSLYRAFILAKINSNWVDEKRDVIFLTQDRVWQRSLSLSLLLPPLALFLLHARVLFLFFVSTTFVSGWFTSLHILSTATAGDICEYSRKHVHINMRLETRISKKKTDEGRNDTYLVFHYSVAIKDSCNRPTYCTLFMLKASANN